MSASYQHALRRLAYVRSERSSSDESTYWVWETTPVPLWPRCDHLGGGLRYVFPPFYYFFLLLRPLLTDRAGFVKVLQGVFGTGKSTLAARGGPRRGDAPPFYRQGRPSSRCQRRQNVARRAHVRGSRLSAFNPSSSHSHLRRLSHLFVPLCSPCI